MTLPARFPAVTLDASVTMPNHVHGILSIRYPENGGAQYLENVAAQYPENVRAQNPENVGAQFIAPTTVNKGVINHAPTSPYPGPTLGGTVRAFKAVCTRRIRAGGMRSFAWQRNYYEHIIRDDGDLNRIRQYISENPLRWERDPENPEAAS